MLADDLWPYGIEAHCKTLDAFLRYAYEQGVCHGQLDVSEVFAKEIAAPGTAADMARFVRQETARWGDVITKAGIKPQ